MAKRNLNVDCRAEITDFIAKIRFAGGLVGLSENQEIAGALNIAPATLSGWVLGIDADGNNIPLNARAERVNAPAFVPTEYLQKLSAVLHVAADVLLEPDLEKFKAAVLHSPMGVNPWSTLINRGLSFSHERGDIGRPIHSAPYMTGRAEISLETFDPNRRIAGPIVGIEPIRKGLSAARPDWMIEVPNHFHARVNLEANDDYQLLLAQSEPKGWSILSPKPHEGLQTSVDGKLQYPGGGTMTTLDGTIGISDVVAILISPNLKLERLLQQLWKHENQSEVLKQIASSLLHNRDEDVDRSTRETKNVNAAIPQFAVLRLQWYQGKGA